MARAFDDASSQYLELNSAPVTAVPLTMACWFVPDDATVNQTLMGVFDKDVNTDSFELIIAGNESGDPVKATAFGGGSFNEAVTTVGYSQDAWQHACAVFASANSRAAYLNGANKGTNSSSRTPANIDRVSIGRRGRSTPSSYMSGWIAEAAIWNVALTDAEVAILATGASPLLVRPQNIVAYWPLIGRHSPEIDIKGGFGLTVTGATAAAHPRIFYPRRRTASGHLVAASWSFVGSGGIVFGGEALPIAGHVFTGAGGLVFGGAADIGDAATTPAVLVDWDGDSDFDDAYEDITSLVLDLQTLTGRDYASQLTGRATPGKLRAVLNNSDDRFSPFNAESPLYGLLKPGRLVTFKYDQTALWIGRLSSLVPSVGGLRKTATLEAVGPMAEVADQRILPLISLNGGYAGELIQEALADSGMDTGAIENSDVLLGPFGTAGVAPVSLLAELRKLEEAEFGFLHEDIEQNRLIFHSRSHRQSLLTSAVLFTDEPNRSLGYEKIDEADWLAQIFNQCIAGVSPYIDSLSGVLNTIAGPIMLGPGESINLFATYSDPVAEWLGHTRTITDETSPVAPAVADVQETAFPTAATSHLVAMPATVNAGELLLCIWAQKSTLDTVIPSGWERMKNSASNHHHGAVIAKIAAGTEGGTTVDFQSEEACEAAAQVYRITGWYGDLEGLKVGGVALGVTGGGDPDPQVYSPPWSTLPTLYIAAFTCGNYHVATGAPTGYGSLDTLYSSLVDGDNVSLASARRTASVASEDAGAFNTDTMSWWWAFLIAVRPSPGDTVVQTYEEPSGRLGSFTIEYDDALGGDVQAHQDIQVSGLALVKYGESLVQADDAASQAASGIRTFKAAVSLFRNATDAQTFAELVVSRYKDAIPVLTIGFEALKHPAYFGQAITRKVGDRITLVATNNAGLGISADFFIEAIHRKLSHGIRSHEVTWDLSPASVTDPS